MNFIADCCNRRFLLVLLLGFFSGLPLSLTGGTLQAWMTQEGVDLATIGRFALVGLPYTLKFTWAPFLDRMPPPFWGRRRGWALVTQACSVLAIVALAYADPKNDMWGLILTALAVTFCSASQDVVVDAFRNEVVGPAEIGRANGLYVIGYRIAMIVSGAGALQLAESLPWRSVYLLLAVVMALSMVVTLKATEPELPPDYTPLTLASWRSQIFEPFVQFFTCAGATEILLFVMVYKLSTMMATALTTPFLIKTGFTLGEIAQATKVVALCATIFGTMAGGVLLDKIGLKAALWIFGALQSTAGLTFILVDAYGHQVILLNIVIFTEYFMMGLGAAALQGFMVSVCSRQFTATQFALLSSITAVSRVVLVSQAGVLQEALGWQSYFLFSALLAIPALLLLTRFTAWQRISRAPLELRDWIQGAGFFVGLLCMSTEAVWRSLQLAGVGKIGATVGAVLVLASVVVGVVPRRQRALNA